MKEFLVIFESDIDMPQWFVVREKFPSLAKIKARRQLRYSVGCERFEHYTCSVVVSR